MPSGDALRVWFPEMVEALTSAWSAATDWNELADLCSRLTELRDRIRSSRGMEPPLMTCPTCGSVSRAVLKDVSISSALFALRKAEVLSDAEFERLDRDWKKHRATQGLDAFGRKKPGAARGTSDSAACC